MNTSCFENQLADCYNQREYEALVMENAGLFLGWEDHIQKLLDNAPDGKITNQRLADGCGVSLNCAARFRHEIPAKRKSVIMIAAILRLSVTETNELLMRWAKYQRLYAKHPADAIWIYILRNGGSNYPKALFDAYWKVYEELLKEEQPEAPAGSFETKLVEQDLMAVRCRSGAVPEEDKAFRAMMRRNLPAYRDGYRKLIDYIDGQYVRLCDGQAGRLTIEEKDELRENLKVTPRGMFRDSKHYLVIYYNRMRKLKRNHVVPERSFLISLGIRLAMSTDQINYMLELAGMAPLCAKDRLESALIFYLEELYMHFPSFFRNNPLEDDADAEPLRDITPAEMAALGEDAPSLRFDSFTESPSEKMTEYIKRRLEETNVFQADEKGIVDEFLGLL